VTRLVMLCSMDATEEPTRPPRLGRLVNHGRREERNAAMKVLVFHGVPTLCLFASKPIAGGTEILYDYGVEVPWEYEVRVSVFVCNLESWFLYFTAALWHGS